MSRGLVGPEAFGVGAAVRADLQPGGGHPAVVLLVVPVGVAPGGMPVWCGQEAAAVPVFDGRPGQAEDSLEVSEEEPAGVLSGRPWVRAERLSGCRDHVCQRRCVRGDRGNALAVPATLRTVQDGLGVGAGMARGGW